jgi:hypothetical protein
MAMDPSAKAEAATEGLATKAELMNLATKADVSDAKAEIIEWMFGTIGFQTLIIMVPHVSSAIHSTPAQHQGS